MGISFGGHSPDTLGSNRFEDSPMPLTKREPTQAPRP